MSPKKSATAKRSAGRWLHPKITKLPFTLRGPMERLKDGRVITVDAYHVLTSRNRGRTWSSRPAFEPHRRHKDYKFSDERVLMRTQSDTLILSFINTNERVWLWRDALKDALAGTRSPHYVTRSTDQGVTWAEPTMLHEDWTGDVRTIIQTRSGKLVISSMKFIHQPGRHGVLTYTSDDDGVTWQPSNLIDLGGCGHHGGVTEATLIQLNDDRIWMLLRTNWGRFWQAFSHDDGQSWRQIEPSNIDASSAPGQLIRLQSGRLMLCWNRNLPEGKKSYPLRGGDGLWSEVPVSNHREELTIAFSDDDGQTFPNPVVIARQRDTYLSYPRMLEYKPGEIWLTTMQGELSLAIKEKDFT